MAFGALGSLVLWITIGRRMMLKYAGISVINALKEPSEDTKDAVFALFDLGYEWLKTPSIDVKRKVQTKDEQGTLSEAEETFSISPAQDMITAVVQNIKMFFLASKGGEKKALQEALQAAAVDPSNPQASSLGAILAAAMGSKGGLDVNKLLTIFLAKYLSGKGPGGGGGGGSW